MAQSMIIGIVKVRANVNNIFRKIEGYTPSGLGARLIPVDRLGWLADENLFFEIFKIRKRAILAGFCISIVSSCFSHSGF